MKYMNYNQKLPKKVEKKLDNYIQRIKKIEWFQQNKNLKKSDVDKQIKIVLKAFGVEAKIEYRQLKNQKAWDTARDTAWDAARDTAWNTARDAAWGAAWDAARNTARNTAWGAAWDAARNTAWGAAWDAARDTAWDAARDAAWGAAWDAARDAAWSADDLLVSDLKNYKKKYPKGNFINLIPLWEMGLYPIGIINGRFIIYTFKLLK